MASKHAANIRSDKDRASDIVRDLRKAMPKWVNGPAQLYRLAREKRSVQHRVLDALRGPKKVGAPKNPLTDEEWLTSVEFWRASMETSAPADTRITDLEVIKDWLMHTPTRRGRSEGSKFLEWSEEGKKEVRRIRDAIVRARRNRKKALKKP
jgi:hypothetical protein